MSYQHVFTDLVAFDRHRQSPAFLAENPNCRGTGLMARGRGQDGAHKNEDDSRHCLTASAVADGPVGVSADGVQLLSGRDR